jgi:hypothetical protein
MALPARLAKAPALGATAALSRLEESPLWPGLKGFSVAGGSEKLQRQVSFHLRSTRLGGVPIAGTTVLQAIPLVLLVFMWLLTRACRSVSRAYNPMGSNQGAPLPTPGTGARDLDRALLILLPACACGLTCWALVRLDAQPWIAVFLSAGLLSHSVLAARMWKDMHRQLHSAAQRSMVRPLPERSWGFKVSDRDSPVR